MEGFEGFTIIDGGSLFILAVSALLAYSRGFVREVLSIIGWVAAAIAAFIFAPDVEPLIREIPFVADLVGDACDLSMIAAFGLVFVGALIVVSIFTPLISGAIQNSALGPLDQGLGFLFGLARGALLIIVALIVYDRLIAGGQGIPMVEDSKTVAVFNDAKQRISEKLPEDASGWISERYERLIGKCEGAAAEAETPDVPATDPTSSTDN